MRNIIVTGIVILLITGGLLVARNISDDSSSSQFKEITAQIESDSGQLIDVREPDEYAAGHAGGAINVPLGDILNGDLSRIDKNKSVYVYCRSGVRAGKAKVALEQAGYKNVTNLGGLSDWQDQGGLVCKSDESTC